MSGWEIALLCLLVLLTVVSGWGAIPILFFALNPVLMRLSFEAPDREQDLISGSTTLRDWIGRLREMGFSLLGIKSEKLPLWRPSYREVSLVSRLSDAYASIVLHPDGNPASLYFFMPLADGGMVFTKNRAFAREAEEDRLSVRNIPSEDFREILDNHQERLRRLQERGSTSLVGSSRESRIDATRGFYRTEYARRAGAGCG